MCEKIGEHFNIFVFYIKISCQSKESLLSKRSHLYSPTFPYLEKIYFLPTLSAKLEELNQSPMQRSGGSDYGL